MMLKILGRFMEFLRTWAAMHEFGEASLGGFVWWKPITWWILISLIIFWLFAIATLMVIYSYYWILLGFYRHKSHDDNFNDEKEEWCKENKLKFYNFRLFGIDSYDLLPLSTGKPLSVRFMFKTDAVAYKLQWME